MNADTVVALLREALTTAILVAAPPLLVALVVGLVISILQATTQIQEQTLTFVPKIIAVLASIIVFGTWMLNVITNYAINLFNQITSVIR